MFLSTKGRNRYLLKDVMDVKTMNIKATMAHNLLFGRILCDNQMKKGKGRSQKEGSGSYIFKQECLQRTLNLSYLLCNIIYELSRSLFVSEILLRSSTAFSFTYQSCLSNIISDNIYHLENYSI